MFVGKSPGSLKKKKVAQFSKVVLLGDAWWTFLNYLSPLVVSGNDAPKCSFVLCVIYFVSIYSSDVRGYSSAEQGSWTWSGQQQILESSKGSNVKLLKTCMKLKRLSARQLHIIRQSVTSVWWKQSVFVLQQPGGVVSLCRSVWDVCLAASLSELQTGDAL